MYIAIIDDDVLNLKILGDFLKDLGHSVVCLDCLDGKQNDWGRLGQKTDLVMVDPGALNHEGLRLVKEIHDHQAGADIMIMSQDKGAFSCPNAKSLSIYCYLNKPVRLAELELLLTRVQERREAAVRPAAF
jgi:DNA-binding NtrC family response regulator